MLINCREINYIDAQLKMACKAEAQGNQRKAEWHFILAEDASEQVTSEKAEEARLQEKAEEAWLQLTSVLEDAEQELLSLWERKE